MVEKLTWVEIDTRAIRHNLKELKRLAKKCRFFIPTRDEFTQTIFNTADILAVIKADAYGHGMVEVARLLEEQGINFFAVSDINEGIVLREAGFKKSILLLETTLPSHVQYISKYQLTPTVCNFELAQALNRYAEETGERVNVHVKVDTGMGRLGVWYTQAFEFIKKLADLRFLTIEGIYTHFPSADTDKKFTRRQLKYLYELVKRLDKEALIIPYIHASNSMGFAGYETHILNLVRPGLMIYGLYPSKHLKRKIKLKPALSVHSKIIFLKKIQKGRSISYGRTFVAKKNMTAATVPIGYSDGYPRALSNKASVIVKGKLCPVLGRVTMDQIVVDVSKVENPTLEMPVVILGRQKNKSITADDLAKSAQTINYEIVCGLGNRLPRVYK